ncbi:MAG: glycosyltransferase family 39 protein [Candidatus Sulfotelmatobacter sp.]
MTQTLSEGPRRRQDYDFKSKLWAGTVVAAVASCSFQLWWFARTCFNEIDYDGVGYIGIARHIRQGEFYAAINSIRSPLISWLIAGLSFTDGDYLHLGKLVNVGSFLMCALLLYVLAESLWRSRLAAALATLLFVLGRSLAAAAVESITPDFLFAALTLVYFLLLLRALRQDRRRDWFLLGAIHGVTFLAKAFALPWLALCTVTALAVSGKQWKTRFARLAAAALIPAVMAAGWAAVLHSKYGVYTTGSQFRLNLVQWTLGAAREHRDMTYAVLTDTTKDYDEYVVLDMPPGSWMWTYPIDVTKAFPKIMRAEIRNLPRAAKEMAVVETPGGLLAFLFAVVALVRRRRQTSPQTSSSSSTSNSEDWRFAVVVAVAAVSLVGAYSMLVVDSRYLFPLMPLVLAVSAGFLAGDGAEFRVWRKACIALVVIGVVFSMTYHASPFRTLTRDFQLSCYDAGNRLKAHSGSRIVSLGAGPFPEHGVGWEAGFKAAYFGGRRIVGAMDSLPDPTELNSLMTDIEKASPDAMLVWGRPDDPRRASLLASLALLYPHNSREKILDPALGEVGVVVFPLGPGGGGT